MKWFVGIFSTAIILTSCSEVQPPVNWQTETIYKNENLGAMMALEVHRDSVIVATGERGHLAISTDFGKTWTTGQIPKADSSQIRAMALLDVHSIIAVTAGQPALIFKTVDRGQNWRLVFEDTTGNAFFDAVHFFNGAKGVLFGDAIDECGYVLITEDSGENWRRVTCSKMPDPLDSESGYAASNSLIHSFGRKVWVATSNSDTGRVLTSMNYGENWTAEPNPLPSDSIAGAMCVRFFNDKKGIIGGGDWLNPDHNAGTIALTSDGGKTWYFPENSPGHISDIAFLPRYNGRVIMAVGQSGLWQSNDAGMNWMQIDSKPLYTLESNAIGTVLFATGKSNIFRFVAE